MPDDNPTPPSATLNQVSESGQSEKTPVITDKPGKMITESDHAEAVYKKITEIKGSDYWIIRLRKRTLILFLGIVILLMWLSILGSRLWQRFGGTVSLKNGMIVVEKPLVTTLIPTPTSVTPGPDIRIRNTLPSASEAAQMAEFLRAQGYLKVEVAPDPDSTISGVGIVTKPGEDALRTQLTTLLANSYNITSPSAELTADSDFEAVIFYGIKAKP